MITPQRYRLSFTFGGLLIEETRRIAKEYAQSKDWEAVRSRVMQENILNKTRSSASFRYFREIRERLKQACRWELELIAGEQEEAAATESDIRLVIFVVATRYYSLLGDFVRDVVRRRIAEGLPTIDSSMFRAYTAELQNSHPELQEISESTERKLTQVAIRMLREAGITAGRREPYQLIRPRLSADIRDTYCAEGSGEDLARLLWSEKEIGECSM